MAWELVSEVCSECFRPIEKRLLDNSYDVFIMIWMGTKDETRSLVRS